MTSDEQRLYNHIDAVIEASRYDSGEPQPTPAQVEAARKAAEAEALAADLKAGAAFRKRGPLTPEDIADLRGGIARCLKTMGY